MINEASGGDGVSHALRLHEFQALNEKLEIALNVFSQLEAVAELFLVGVDD